MYTKQEWIKQNPRIDEINIFNSVNNVEKLELNFTITR